MKKLSSLILLFLIIGFSLYAEDYIMLYGRVKTAISNHNLTDAYVLTYDSVGNVKDSIRANKGYRWTREGIDTLSDFSIKVPRVDSLIVFDVVCEGFQPQTITYNLKNIKKNETYRELPTILMRRATTLKEVTVTATKIKFFNKGDTLVYDATAFELPEGSMLDELISQLPGAELSTDGQIKINGEVVESLLLDGKKFFDGNNNLMLENIAAYTVKNIQVYEGVSKEDKQKGNFANKVLTMNVSLKKEYNIGWLINLQGGYGTSDRYLGKAFVSWFNPRWRVSFIGNANNLNDNRKPGRNDTWTPDMLPSGKKEFLEGGFNYNFETVDEKTEANGSLMFSNTINNVETFTDRINFLPGGDTYERNFSNSHDRQTSISTNHHFYTRKKDVTFMFNLSGAYNQGKNSASSLSGAFDKDPGEMTRSMLEAIYSDGSPEKLESIINRAATRNDGWQTRWGGDIGPYLSWKLPWGSSRLSASMSFSYSNQKPELWKDYEINYGINPGETEKLRQYFNNSPNIEKTWSAQLGYTTSFNSLYINLYYSYQFTDAKQDSYMYALDRLNDMGIYGEVPSDYLLAFDPANSYKSHRWQNRHNLSPMIQWFKSFDKSRLLLMVNGMFSYIHRKFSYWRDNEDYSLKTSNFLPYFSSRYSAQINYAWDKYGEGQQQNYRNTLQYSYIVDPSMPNLFNMVDVVDDSDPLNIFYGNPDLKPSIRQRHQAWWWYKPQSVKINNDLSVSYTTVHNEKTMGFVYDTETGVRHNKMYNVNGNRTLAISDNVQWQFGKKEQFTLSYGFDAGVSQVTDMIGTNGSMPQLTYVHTTTTTQRFRFAWQLGKQNIALRVDGNTRHATSEQPGFSTLNAYHINAGVQGVFVLPEGFGISTDFTCYTRRGYGLSYLDTTDPVWNIRFSYAPPKNKHWVFMVDGFDMLHQLSNVNYAVTASGRTISYTNMIPRYFMLSIQYRLNIQPKKR